MNIDDLTVQEKIEEDAYVQYEVFGARYRVISNLLRQRRTPGGLRSAKRAAHAMLKFAKTNETNLCGAEISDLLIWAKDLEDICSA